MLIQDELYLLQQAQNAQFFFGLQPRWHVRKADIAITKLVAQDRGETYIYPPKVVSKALHRQLDSLRPLVPVFDPFHVFRNR